MRLLIIFMHLILLLFWTPGAWSQKGPDSASPIKIEADRMETSREESTVLFSGNVKASQGSLIIDADEMTVQYGRPGSETDRTAGTAAPQSRKIDKILAKGNVKIVQGDWITAGDTMDFNAIDRIVILAGNAKAWQDQNMVSGEKITLYLDERKSVVEGGGKEDGRVKAFIYPSTQENTDSRKTEEK